MLEENALQNSLNMMQVFINRPLHLIFDEDKEGEKLVANLLWPPQWQGLFFTGLDLPTKIGRIWSDPAVISPAVQNHLCTHLSDLALVVSTQPFTQLWGLAYLKKYATINGVGIECWLGGIPAGVTDIALAQKRLGRPLPPSYLAFTHLHNGFTHSGNFGYGFQALQTLEPQANVLPFYEDGAGNQQVYCWSEPEKEDFWTYDYDHETHEYTQPALFTGFLENWLTAVFNS